MIMYNKQNFCIRDVHFKGSRPGPEVIIFFHAKLNCAIVGILTFISMINTASESFKARKIFAFQHSTFNEQFKFHAQLN